MSSQNGNDGKMDAVIRITRSEETYGFGQLPDKANVFIPGQPLTAAIRKCGTSDLRGRYFRATIGPNRDTEHVGQTPWVCLYVIEEVEVSDFNQLPKDNGGHANGIVSIPAEPEDELDKVYERTANAAVSLVAPLSLETIREIKQQTAIEVDEADFPRVVRERLKAAEAANKLNGRDALAYVMSHDGMPAILLDLVRERLEKIEVPTITVVEQEDEPELDAEVEDVSDEEPGPTAALYEADAEAKRPEKRVPKTTATPLTTAA